MAPAALSFTLLAAVAPAVAQISIDPVPAQKSSCTLPPTLQGVTGHVLFRYRVNQKGRVEFVKPLYTSVEPPDQAAALTGSLADCLKERQHPVRGRTDFHVSVPMLMAFHFFRPIPTGASLVRIFGGRQVPRIVLEAMNQEKMALAGKLLSGSGFKEVRGGGWVLRTDVNSATRKTIQDGLEFSTLAFDAAFPATPPVPEASPLTIFVFRDGEEFQQVAAFDNLVPHGGMIAGEYTPWDRLIYTEAGADRPLKQVAAVVAHEATHHIVSQRLYTGGRTPPFWVNEGIATFVECLRAGGREGLDLAAVDRSKAFKGPYQWRAHANVYLDALASAGDARLPKLSVLLGDHPDGEIPYATDLVYGTSWLLVHYLINAEGGRYRTPFRDWMMDAASSGEPDSLAAGLGRPLAEIEANLRDYLRSLR